MITEEEHRKTMLELRAELRELVAESVLIRQHVADMLEHCGYFKEKHEPQ